jgi:hypothetical protein
VGDVGWLAHIFAIVDPYGDYYGDRGGLITLHECTIWPLVSLNTSTMQCRAPTAFVSTIFLASVSTVTWNVSSHFSPLVPLCLFNTGYSISTETFTWVIIFSTVPLKSSGLGGWYML